MMCHTENASAKPSIRLLAATVVLCLSLASLGGCGQPTIFKNPDPDLRKSNTEFREDATARFPYKADAPHQKELRARAQVGYVLNRLEVVNFTDEDWTNVEVWVNRQYVCFLPTMKSRQLKEVHFPMLFDAQGKRFPMGGKDRRVESIELYRNGVMYSLIFHNGDY